MLGTPLAQKHIKIIFQSTSATAPVHMCTYLVGLDTKFKSWAVQILAIQYCDDF